MKYDQYRPSLLFKDKLELIHVVYDEYLPVYDQYRPALLFKNKLALIHVVLDSFVIVTSLISNDGLSVNQEQERGKQWWALVQQLPYCKFTTWSMINIDLLYYLKISWLLFMCFFTHF
jgi:hypothetical protein